MVVLGGGVVSYERGTPNPEPRTRATQETRVEAVAALANLARSAVAQRRYTPRTASVLLATPLPCVRRGARETTGYEPVRRVRGGRCM